MASAAVYDVYTIPSSSPSRPFHATSINMSSSPSFPSPSKLVSRRPSMPLTGIRAAEFPSNSSGSASAATLLKKAFADDAVDAIRSFRAAIENDIEDNAVSAKNAKLKLPSTSVKEKREVLGGGIPAEVKKVRKPRARKAGTEGVAGTVNKEKVPRKPRAKKVDIGDVGGSNVKEKASRKPRSKKLGIDVEDASAILKAVRNPKATKSAKETAQSKFPTGRVTKNTSSKSKKADNEKAQKTESVSKHFGSRYDTIDSFVKSSDEGLHLQEAVKRRSSWTPPPATTKTLPLTTPFTIDLVEGDQNSGGSPNSEQKTKKFGDLLSNFGFTKTESCATEKRLFDSTGTRKRKLIELVTTNSSTSITPPAEQIKVPKKRPKTITDQATLAYALGDEDAESAHPAPLLQYFPYSGSEGAEVLPKSRSRSPVKNASKASNSKKGTVLAPILLSPESALKQVDKQDFVFGTSSQLARDESPTFLRDLHQALQASNEVEDDPFASDPFEDVLRESAAIFSKCGVQSDSTDRSLWSAAQRDSTGKLLEVEMLDLVASPAIERNQPCDKDESMVAIPHPGDDDIWHDLDSAGPSPIRQSQASELNTTDSELVHPPNAHIDKRDTLPPPENDGTSFYPTGNELWRDIDAQPLMQQPSPKSSSQVGPIKAVIRPELRNSSRSIKPVEPIQTTNSPSPSKANEVQPKTVPKSTSKTLEIPDFSAYTEAQLAKEVASYHFKPVKKRSAAIALLEKCWEGKQRLALGVLGTNAIVGTSTNRAASSQAAASEAASSPRKPRGRPRKNSTTVASPKSKQPAKSRTKSSQVLEEPEIISDVPVSLAQIPKKSKKKGSQVDEISDSDSPTTPSPPRRVALQVQTPPLPLRLSTSVDVDESPALSPASSQARLYSYITRAIKAASPSKNPVVPNWHEKILLYDPIILEDLALWLNTGALEKAGWDGEVAPAEVKKFCESKSICCLWKENLRGGARSRY